MTRQTAPFLPATCTRCGAIFRAQLFAGVEISNLVIGPGGVPVQCPECGGLARTVEGVFNYTDAAIEVLAAPDVTLEMLRTLHAVLQGAHEKSISTDEAQQLAKVISPSFARLFDPRLWSTEVTAAWVAVIGLAGVTVLQWYLNPNSSGATKDIKAGNSVDIIAGNEGKPTAEILDDFRKYLELLEQHLERAGTAALAPKLTLPEPPIPRLKPTQTPADVGKGDASSPERDQGKGEPR